MPEEKVIAVTKQRGFVTRKEIEILLGMGQSSCGRLLKKMIENGLLIQKIHGYASCERHFLYYRRRENAVWRVGGENFLSPVNISNSTRPSNFPASSHPS